MAQTPRIASIVVLAITLACGSNDDDDNDDTSSASGTIRSVRNLAGTNAVGLDTLFDRQRDNIVVAALQSGEADYGRGTVGEAGKIVLVLTRYNADLQALWQTVIDAGFTGSPPHIALDPSGNVALVVSGFDSADVGHGAVTPPMVALFSGADGSARWSTSLARDPTPDPRFVVVDPTGDVFVGSNVIDTAEHVVIDRFTGASGVSVQSRQVGQTTGNMALDSMAIDSDGNLVIAGTFDGTVSLSDAYTAVSGQAWGYVAKVGKDSTASLWSRPLRLRDASQHVVVSTLTGGDVAIAGEFAFADDTSDTADPSSTLAYLRLARLSAADGATSWTTRSEQQNTASLTLVDLADDVDDFYLTMTFNGNLTLAETTAVSTTASAMAVLHASGSDGAEEWLRYSETSSTHAGRVGLDAAGNPETSGTFTTTADDDSSIESIYFIEIVD